MLPLGTAFKDLADGRGKLTNKMYRDGGGCWEAGSRNETQEGVEIDELYQIVTPSLSWQPYMSGREESRRWSQDSTLCWMEGR